MRSCEASALHCSASRLAMRAASCGASLAPGADMHDEHALRLRFDSPALLAELDALGSVAHDDLPFGVIKMTSDSEARVVGYNAFESRRSGLSPDRVVGLPFFQVVAQCMNNFMVAQRFEDARSAGTPLDVALEYVLTLRMRPSPVVLRLLSAPNVGSQYIAVHWPSVST
jgi:photoactive yellow protein